MAAKLLAQTTVPGALCKLTNSSEDNVVITYTLGLINIISLTGWFSKCFSQCSACYTYFLFAN